MFKRYPDLKNWIKKGRKSSSPTFGKGDDKYGLTWHHNDKTGLLELVDFQDHRSNFSLYHPDGKGGREKWGGGEAGRQGQLDGLTGKSKNKNCTI